MKVYWSPNSPYARRVVVVTREMQIDRCVEFIDTTSAETSLSPRTSAPKATSSRLAARQQFEQRLGRLCGPIDGVPIAIDPRNDEAALHDSNEHQRKLAGIKAFRNFAVGLSLAESSRKDLLEFAEIAFNRLPQRELGDGRFGSKSAHPATFEAVAGNVEIAEDTIQSRTARSNGLARELAHFIGHFTKSHRRQVHLSLEVVIETTLPRTTFFQQVARTCGLVATLPHQLLGRLNKLALRFHDILKIASNQPNVIVFCNYWYVQTTAINGYQPCFLNACVHDHGTIMTRATSPFHAGDQTIQSLAVLRDRMD